MGEVEAARAFTPSEKIQPWEKLEAPVPPCATVRAFERKRVPKRA